MMEPAFCSLCICGCDAPLFFSNTDDQIQTLKINFMYTVDYFIKKFEAIPEEKWGINFYGDDDVHCALGHCGVTNDTNEFSYGKEGDSLFDLIIKSLHCGITDLNDGSNKNYQQPTPKQRILAALYDIKTGQKTKFAPEVVEQNVCDYEEEEDLYEDITKSLAVLPQEETTDIKKQSSYKGASM